MSFIRYFIAVPRIVLKDNEYSSTDKLVLGLINSLSNNKGYCYAKNSKLATELNVGTKTISNSLSKLKKNKIIIIEYLEYQRRIYLNPEIVSQENAKDIKSILNKYKNIKKLNKIIVDEFVEKIYIGKLNKETNTREIKIIWNLDL